MTDKANMRPVSDMTDEMLVGSLLALYKCQTPDEQNNKGTTHENGWGFNAFDAPSLTDMARFYLKNEYLTERQIAFVKRTIVKYDKQLETLKPVPVPIKKLAKVASIGKIVSYVGGDLIIQFPYNVQTIEVVKSISGRKWDSAHKRWTCPTSVWNIEFLVEQGFTLQAGVQTWYAQALEKSKPSKTGLSIPGFSALFDFQIKGVEFIEAKGGRALIADEMGLGKTIQALAYLGLHPTKRPAVIVCPASLKLNWEREAVKWNKEVVQVWDGKTTKAMPKATIHVINYDILQRKLAAIKAMKPKVLVFDESHYLKNQKALRTKAAMQLAGGIPHVIGLSGTPIINRPIEFYTILRILQPKEWPSFWRYAQTYCGAKHNGYGWDFNGATNVEQLNKNLIRSVMLRRLKSEVLKELPPKVRTVIPLRISNQAQYNQAANDIIAYISNAEGLEAAEKASNAEVLVQMEKLKQLALEGKLKESIQWIRDYIDNDAKLVVFATHTATIDALMTEFRECAVRLDGSTSTINRQLAVDAFQTNDDCKLFVGNIKAAGVGLTLTAASATCFLEFAWTPGEHDQAEDRVHRIGQTADSVNAYYLVGLDTIDEEIASLLDKKRKVLSKILDGGEATEDSLFTELIGKLVKR